MAIALKIEHVNKSYGKKQILHDVCLETNTGEVFGFLGPNGAGKTTLIKLIVGLTTIDDGTISVCGADIEKEFEKAMANIGGIVENPELYKYMTGMQNLKQYANMRKGVTKERIDEVVELVGLSNRINEKVSKYSLGMRQRLGLAQALLHKPKVLILDEPTNGLDPAGIKQLRDILKNVAHNEDVCVFVSSHLMSEMELMCDRVGIIVRGTVKSVQTIDEMIKSVNNDIVTYTFRVNDIVAAKNILQDKYPNYILCDEQGNSFKLEVPKEGADDAVADVISYFVGEGARIYEVQRNENRSLEEAFIELTDEGGTQIA